MGKLLGKLRNGWNISDLSILSDHKMGGHGIMQRLQLVGVSSPRRVTVPGDSSD